MLAKTKKNQFAYASEMLAQERKDLTNAFLAGREPALLLKHSHILDAYFRESFERSMIGPRMGIEKNPYAIIALGGYGRQEQCIHSDVDLLFLFKKSVPPTAEELIREVVYPLWDLGLEVGHATRSFKECIYFAAEDYEILTSLLDARFICGMSLLYTELMDQLRHSLLKSKAKRVIEWLIDTNRRRHAQFGDSAYLLEPNLKEGHGGLRDYHTMLWIARITHQIKERRDLEYYGLLSHYEYQALSRALSFIWQVRNRLHHLAGRKCDQLHFEFQIKLADSMGYMQDQGQQPVEILLGELHGQMEVLKQQHLIFLYEHGFGLRRQRRRFLLKKPPAGKPLKIPGLMLNHGMIEFESSEIILRQPALLMQIFEESARTKQPLSAQARRLVREFLYLVNESMANAREVVKSFEKILVTPAKTFNILNDMLNTGFLPRFIPEFQQVVNRIQYDAYHLYPVDRHLLRVVRTLKSFGTPDDPTHDQLCGKLYQELRRKKTLLWAALLHDIGKGNSLGNHSETGQAMVTEILTRKGLSTRNIQAAAFLVREHLLLAKTATRRDINDEETAITLARRVGDIELLKMLYLLTVADSVATGPKAWNEWMAALLRSLFLKVLNILERGELASREAVKTIEAKRAQVMASTGDAEESSRLATLFKVMSPRYLLSVPEKAILDHARLYDRIEQRDFVWQIASTPEADTRTVTVCAKDHPGLFSKIAGVFTLAGVNILAAQIFTWRNNTALDIFQVTPPPDRLFEQERWERAESKLGAVLRGQLDLKAALKTKIAAYPTKVPVAGRPHRVVVDNDSSSFFTIIEVFTHDDIGLLFKITDTLFRCKLDIWVAKIATKIDQVVDVFYVRDFDGQKIDAPEQVEAIQAAIISVLE